MSATSTPIRTPSLELRPIRFEEVASILGLIERAIERGCRDHYNPAQRRAVFLTYARGLFAEALGPFESIVAVQGGSPVGFAQVDPATDRLRAAFVEGDLQQRGVGSLLLGEIERRLRQRGGERLHGAMSLNAVPFYARAGFRALGAPESLASAGISVPVVRMEKVFRGWQR
jgi:GNAT superfamily N-acetyltransferase